LALGVNETDFFGSLPTPGYKQVSDGLLNSDDLIKIVGIRYVNNGCHVMTSAASKAPVENIARAIREMVDSAEEVAPLLD